MNRTRVVFFTVLVVFLAIVAASLALRLIDHGRLVQFFIAATVFSVGVIALDFLGILDHDQAGDAGHDLDVWGAGQGAGADHGVDVGHADMGDVAGHDDGVDAHHDGGYNGHGSPVLSVLAYLRLLVYFSLGFGPTGWVAVASGRGALTSLLLAAAMGMLSLGLAQAFFRFQRSDTDSSLHREDLIQAQATVVVPLSHRTMGKVRVQIGMNVTEQYALADHPDTHFQKGDVVQISRVTDECVYVM